MIEILWEFRVKEGFREEFEEVYGRDGRWAKFFRSDPAYHGTTLLRDVLDPLRYATLDGWSSRAAYNSFRDTHAAEYQELDRSCSHLTTEEHFAGFFEVL